LVRHGRFAAPAFRFGDHKNAESTQARESGTDEERLAMTGRSTVKLASTLFVAVLMLAAGCSRSSDVSVSSPTGKTSGAPEPLTFVALGDSWPEGDHCGYCETFAGRYAEGLEALVGGPVDFLDFTGHAQPGLEVHGGGGTASLLRALR
jgi:hypothetical protein